MLNANQMNQIPCSNNNIMVFSKASPSLFATPLACPKSASMLSRCLTKFHHILRLNIGSGNYSQKQMQSFQANQRYRRQREINMLIMENQNTVAVRNRSKHAIFQCRLSESLHLSLKGEQLKEMAELAKRKLVSQRPNRQLVKYVPPEQEETQEPHAIDKIHQSKIACELLVLSARKLVTSKVPKRNPVARYYLKYQPLRERVSSEIIELQVLKLVSDRIATIKCHQQFELTCTIEPIVRGVDTVPNVYQAESQGNPQLDLIIMPTALL